MEAFTEQCQTSSGNSITTYLEGEILDFNRHTFKTFSFKSNDWADANNWRKLEPFLGMSNAAIVKGLVSKKFMRDLSQNWVFMRWKGA